MTVRRRRVGTSLTTRSSRTTRSSGYSGSIMVPLLVKRLRNLYPHRGIS